MASVRTEHLSWQDNRRKGRTIWDHARAHQGYTGAEEKGGQMASGILVPVVDFAGMAEDEFNDWYDLEHIPERLRVPGFVACERWITQ
jgi:hypothetical protein